MAVSLDLRILFERTPSSRARFLAVAKEANQSNCQEKLADSSVSGERGAMVLIFGGWDKCVGTGRQTAEYPWKTTEGRYFLSLTLRSDESH